MSCCGNKNNRYYTRQNLDKSCCGCRKNSFDNDYSYSEIDGLDSISCPFHANNDSCCERSLAEALCHLTNQRVIIHSDGCKMCVVIASVGKCFVKTINPCTHRIVYFNINRIDNIEDVLPRCY